MNAGQLRLWAVRGTVATVLCLAVAATSRVPWSSGDGERTQLRLSWGGIAHTTEACRPPTEEELTGLPQHMRPREICDGAPVGFNLRLVVDGDTLVQGPIVGGGRSERAYTVYHQFVLNPGTHRLALDLWPDSAGATLPPGLHQSLREVLDLPAGRATLLTLDSGGQLAVRR